MARSAWPKGMAPPQAVRGLAVYPVTANCNSASPQALNSHRQAPARGASAHPWGGFFCPVCGAPFSGNSSPPAHVAMETQFRVWPLSVFRSLAVLPRSFHLCLPSAGIKGVRHHRRLLPQSKLKFSVRESQRLSSLIKIRRKSPQKVLWLFKNREGSRQTHTTSVSLHNYSSQSLSASRDGSRGSPDRKPRFFSNSTCTELEGFFFPVAFCTFFQIP